MAQYHVQCPKFEVDEIEGKETPTDIKSYYSVDCNNDTEVVITQALDIIDKYDIFNKAVQVLKNEDPSVKKPMVVELPEEDTDNLKSERGNELISKLITMTGKEEAITTCKTYYDA